jgi:hypothetical protein
MPLGRVQAQAPSPVVTITGTVSPGESQEQPFTIPQDLDEYLFYAQGPSVATADDTFDVTIEETGDAWWSLQGQQWLRSSALDAGEYTLLVEANTDATAPIAYTVSFYSIPAVPVTFGGVNLATSSYDSSELEADFFADGNYTVTFGVQGGPCEGCEVLLDGESIMEAPGTVSAEVSEGSHQLDIYLPSEQVTSWSITIGGLVSMSQTTSATETTSMTQSTSLSETTTAETQPHLSVSIVSSCPTLNESAGEFNCTLAAQATASDEASPEITYMWSATGGSFNSTIGQYVNWAAPEINETETFTISVIASASGYYNGVTTTAIVVQPVPEFQVLPIVSLVLALTTTCLISRRRLLRTGS